MWGETTKVENRGETTRGETTRGETSWGRNVLLPVVDTNQNQNSLLVIRQFDNPSPVAVTGGN